MNEDLKAAHAHATMAIAAALRVTFAKLTEPQLAEMRRHTKEGTGRVTLVATLHGGAVHVELALMKKPEGEVIFENALLRFDGAAEVAFTPPDAVRVTDRATLN